MKIAILLLSAFVLAVNCHPHRRQVASCSTFCPMYVMTFCGSDGQTYTSNPCVVKSQKCMKGANDFDTFTSVHYGACTGDELKEATTVA